MSRAQTLAWLSELQERFGTMLRTPLDRQSGALRAPTETYGGELCRDVLPGPTTTERERLAVYHRQYWFRLFTVLQGEYKLVARLLGMWAFNELAADYLREHPPRSFDLQHIAHDFVPYLTSESSKLARYGLPREALLEAATLDHTFARVFLAPETERLDARRSSMEELVSMQLKLAPTVVLLSEHWPLMELRRRVLAESDERAVKLPEALGSPQFWAVFRTDRGHGVAALEPLAYRLFSLLAGRTLLEALAELEASCSPDELEVLPARVQALLRDSVRAGFWAA